MSNSSADIVLIVLWGPNQGRVRSRINGHVVTSPHTLALSASAHSLSVSFARRSIQMLPWFGKYANGATEELTCSTSSSEQPLSLTD